MRPLCKHKNFKEGKFIISCCVQRYSGIHVAEGTEEAGLEVQGGQLEGPQTSRKERMWASTWE